MAPRGQVLLAFGRFDRDEFDVDQLRRPRAQRLADPRIGPRHGIGDRALAGSQRIERQRGLGREKRRTTTQGDGNEEDTSEDLHGRDHFPANSRDRRQSLSVEYARARGGTQYRRLRVMLGLSDVLVWLADVIVLSIETTTASSCPLP